MADNRPYILSKKDRPLLPEAPKPFVTDKDKLEPLPKDKKPVVEKKEKDGGANKQPTIDNRKIPGAKYTGAVFGKTYEIRGITYYRLDKVDTFVQVGLASWYGTEEHGKKTANGEVFNMYAATAAHKNLPLGSVVEVESLETGKKTIARINDRGPHVENRIIDLSYRGAQELGIVDSGTTKVIVRLLDKSKYKEAELKNPAVKTAYVKNNGHAEEPNRGLGAHYAVQLGSFTDKVNADSVASKFEKARVVKANINGTYFYRVQVAGFTTREKAEQYADKASGMFPGAYVLSY